MIWYHQAYDFNHCIFRTLSILEYNKGMMLELEKAKIINFYLLFPSKLKDVQFPKKGVKYKKHFKDIDDRYNKVTSSKITYTKISSLCDICFSAISSFNLIERDSFSKGYLVRTEKKLTNNLSDKIQSYHEQDDILFDLMTNVFAEIPLSGRQGLKVRTDLIDYRYDAG